MQIGPYTLDNPLALAPMVGVTDRFFRDLCRRLGAGYTITEMLAANPALRDSPKARLRGAFDLERPPFAVQIAGGDPQWMADAARYNADRGAPIIDINMGCPAKKVCRQQAGSALLSDPDLVRRILQAVVQAVDVPVTLKTRTGPDPANRNGLEIARMAEDSGIAALAVHGRTRSDRFRGDAEYRTIREICRSVSIPVFANGDVRTPAEAADVLRFTGADGLMIGRAAQGNPWIFGQVRHYLDHGELLAAPPPAEVHAVMVDHLHALHEAYGEHRGVRVARKHIGWYLDGQPESGDFKSRLMRARSPSEQFALLDACFSRREAQAA